MMPGYNQYGVGINPTQPGGQDTSGMAANNAANNATTFPQGVTGNMDNDMDVLVDNNVGPMPQRFNQNNGRGNAVSQAGYNDNAVSQAGFNGNVIPQTGFNNRVASQTGFNNRVAPQTSFNNRAASQTGFNNRAASQTGFNNRIASQAVSNAASQVGPYNDGAYTMVQQQLMNLRVGNTDYGSNRGTVSATAGLYTEPWASGASGASGVSGTVVSTPNYYQPLPAVETIRPIGNRGNETADSQQIIRQPGYNVGSGHSNATASGRSDGRVPRDYFAPMAAVNNPPNLRGNRNLSYQERVVARQMGISASYGGSILNPNNWSQDIRDDENASVWITGLPPSTSHHTLLTAARGIGHTGKVFACVINAPEPEKGHKDAAAKLVYFTHEAAARLVKTNMFLCNGSPCRISWNRIKASSTTDEDRDIFKYQRAQLTENLDKYTTSVGPVPPGVEGDQYVRECMTRDGLTMESFGKHAYDNLPRPPTGDTITRVIVMIGPAQQCKVEFLNGYFSQRFQYQTDQIKTHWTEEYSGKMLSCVEWRFGSYRCQAQSAMKIMRLDLADIMKAWYGIDPLETGTDPWIDEQTALLDVQRAMGYHSPGSDDAFHEAGPVARVAVPRFCVFHGTMLPCGTCNDNHVDDESFAARPIIRDQTNDQSTQTAVEHQTNDQSTQTNSIIQSTVEHQSYGQSTETNSIIQSAFQDQIYVQPTRIPTVRMETPIAPIAPRAMIASGYPAGRESSANFNARPVYKNGNPPPPRRTSDLLAMVGGVTGGMAGGVGQSFTPHVTTPVESADEDDQSFFDRTPAHKRRAALGAMGGSQVNVPRVASNWGPRKISGNVPTGWNQADFRFAGTAFGVAPDDTLWAKRFAEGHDANDGDDKSDDEKSNDGGDNSSL